MGRKRPPIVATLLRLAPFTLLSACIADAPLDSLQARGPFAERINDLFWPVFWVATAFFVLVEGGVLLAVLFFRERPGRKEPRQIHGSPRLELVWTVIPALILTGIAFPTVRSIFDLTRCGSGAMPVEVIGHQWWFEYRYPQSGVVTANVMVIPAGQEVCATMTSEDVIHNFWVPNLNGKRYLVPGHTTLLRLQADEPGEYWAHCGEFCGLSHSLMRARVLAVEPEAFQAWIVAQKLEPELPEAGSPAATGRDVFLNKQCTQCHNIVGTNPLADAFAPDLTHFAGRAVFAGATLPEFGEDRATALKRWLANPPEVKPGSYMPDLNLTEAEIDALIAYLETLK